MKRLFVILSLIAMVLASASAEVVFEAEGRGATLDEAKESARIALAEKVFPGTIVADTKSQVTDGSDGYSATFSQSSSYSIVGEFPGFDYTVVSSTPGDCVVTTEIAGDARTLLFYSNKLNEQKGAVGEFYRRYRAMDSTVVSAMKRRDALSKVIEYYYYFNLYSNIILRLGGTPEDIGIGTTFAVLQEDYKSLIDEVANELATKSSAESVSQEVLDELEKNRKAQEEYEKAQEDAVAQSELQRRLLLDARIASTLEGRGENSDLEIDPTLGLVGFANYLEVIDNANFSLAELTEEYDNLRKDQAAAIEKSYEEEALAIRNRTYKRAFLDANGNPTAIGKEIREDEVNALRAQKDKEKEETLQTIDSKFCSVIQSQYDFFMEAIALLEEKEFTLYSNKGDVSFTSISAYDGNNYRWSLDVKAESPVEIDIDDIILTYEDLTGEQIPSVRDELKTFLSSTKYTDTIDNFAELLARGQYDFTVSFTVKISLTGKLNIKLTRFNISFYEGTEAEVSLQKRSTISVDHKFDRTNFTSYTWLKKYTGKTAAASSVKTAGTSDSSSSSAESSASSVETVTQTDVTTGTTESKSTTATAVSAVISESSISAMTERLKTTATTAANPSSDSGSTTTRISSDGSVSTTTIATSSVSTKNAAGKSRVSIFVHGGALYGGLYNDSLKAAADALAEIRVYIGPVFISGAVDFAYWKPSFTQFFEGMTVLQYGGLGGLGFRIGDYVTVGCRASYGKSDGFLLNPYLAIKIFRAGSLRMEGTAGCYYNWKSQHYALFGALAVDWGF